ncbi:MAG: hemin receptor [Anaerolineales bacterium]|nr:hemin receptor [Anaerolineales bacterium]
MNTQEILTLQQSFAQVEPIADTAASLFYGRLFELDPNLRPLFKADLKTQGEKLMSALKLVVIGLDNPERIIPAVQSLGQRHAGYGVRPEHYATVGAALLWTLEKGLGAAYTPEVESAWENAFALLSGLMQEAAYQPA